MTRAFRLTVLTPEQTLLDVQRVAWVQVQLADGGPIGVYPGHAPLLAETVVAPLRYKDPSGEHALDLNAGILQVGSEGVTVLASARAFETRETLEVAKDDERFDRLAQELLTTLGAHSDGVQGSEKE
jgi:F-type H+-transporting ATPase subunit epsilon